MENTFLEVAAVLLGFVLRLGVPILLTVVVAIFLKKLDKRWQEQAEAERAEVQALTSNAGKRIPCWELHNCPPGMRKNCRAFAHPETPCWELFRTDGQLKPACKNCKVRPPDVPGLIAIT